MLRRILSRLIGRKSPEPHAPEVRKAAHQEQHPPVVTPDSPASGTARDPEATAQAPNPQEGNAASHNPGASAEAVREQTMGAIKSIFDPEIPVNIYDLGLIYDVSVDATGMVDIKMTLTAPACPAAGYLPGQVKDAVLGVPGVRDVRLELVWDPPWSPDRMSDAVKLQLGML